MIVLLAAGCSSTPSSNKARPKLSDAAEQASKPKDEQESVRPKKDKPEEPEEPPVFHEPPDEGGAWVVVEDEESDPGSLSPAEEGGGTGPVHLGVVLGGARMRGRQFEGFGAFGLQVGAYLAENRWRFDAELLAGPMAARQGSAAAGGLENDFQVTAGGLARFYLVPPSSRFGPYLFAGFRAGALFWDYRERITIVDYTGEYVLDSDSVGLTELFLGVGASFLRKGPFQLGASVSFGYAEYDDETYEGFENDLMDDEGFVQILFEMDFASF